MNRISCKQVSPLLDDYVNDTLLQQDKEMISIHLAVCRSCNERLLVWQGLGLAVGEAEIEPLSAFVEKRILDNVKLPSIKPQKQWPRLRVYATGLAAATASVLAIFLWFSPLFSDIPKVVEVPQGVEPKPLAKTDKTKRNVSVPAIKPVPELRYTQARNGIEISPGNMLWLKKSAKVNVVEQNRQIVRFSLSEGYVLADLGTIRKGYRFIIETPSGEVEARGTAFSVEVLPNKEERVRVLEGVVDVRCAHASNQSVTLEGGEEIRVGESTPQRASKVSHLIDLAFIKESSLQKASIEPDEPAPTLAMAKDQMDIVKTRSKRRSERRRALVEEIGSNNEHVEPFNNDGNTLALRAIADGRLDEADLLVQKAAKTNPKNPKTIDMLVKLARAHKRAGNFYSAREIYMQLDQGYPNSQAAANGRVALGQMALDGMKRPNEAVRHFEAYLNRLPNGILAEVARAGRVRALARLARHRQVISAANNYLKHHLKDRSAPEIVRLMADSYRKMGDCKQALRYYAYLLRMWPKSDEAIVAEAGLKVCREVEPH